jgi:glycosyltransferase involved in cell wall biosynthesis
MTGTDLNQKTGEEERDALKSAIAIASRIVVFNEDFRYRLIARCTGTAGKIVCVPQGVRLEAGRDFSRAELGLREEETVFILPSGLREIKNVELAISGLERARESNPQIRLLVVGAAIEEDYSGRIEKLLLEKDWASYLGEVPHSWMSGLLRLSDVVLNTSRSEGQPQGALEGMSLGKPAVLTPVPGNRGVIRHGVEGFYVADEEDLATAANDLAGSKRLRLLMGRQAKETVERRFSAEKEAAAYAALYNELAFGRP